MKLAGLARAAVLSLAIAGCGRSHATPTDAGTEAGTHEGGAGSTATAGAGGAGAAAGTAGATGVAGVGGSTGGASGTGGGAGGSFLFDGGSDVADAGHDAAGGAGQDGGAKDSSPDGAAGRPPDTCAKDVDCPGGSCWLRLDGSKACVTKVKAGAVDTCQGVTTKCCVHDTDCTTPPGGLCVPIVSVTTTYCGGAVPFGGACRNDECVKDADCDATKPADAAKSACFPAGLYGDRKIFTETCVFGACRTDDDCAQSAGGRCTFGLGPTHGDCNLQYVTYCAYPSDPCHLDGFTSIGCDPIPETPPTICVPQDNLQGMHCGLGPPMRP